jgi:hypothetical protein
VGIEAEINFIASYFNKDSKELKIDLIGCINNLKIKFL